MYIYFIIYCILCIFTSSPFEHFLRGATAAATAEEVPNFSSLHPITHRDQISRSGTPLTPIRFRRLISTLGHMA